MVLKNHIASRLLKNDALALEMVMEMFPEEVKKKGGDIPEPAIEKMANFYKLIGGGETGIADRIYYVTNTVIDKLDLLKVKKNEQTKYYDWSIFKNVKQGKRMFIFDENKCLRMWKDEDRIHLCMIAYEKNDSELNPFVEVNQPVKGSNIEGKIVWDIFWVQMDDNTHSDNYFDKRIQAFDVFVYKLMCFIYLSDNEEIIVEPGMKHGTKKSGKLINTLNIPVVIVNSRWNITVIRNEGFNVSGHLRIYKPKGERSEPLMVQIQPYQKKGYVRKALSTTA